jgi:hypothetical protein
MGEGIPELATGDEGPGGPEDGGGATKLEPAKTAPEAPSGPSCPSHVSAT